jgi:hypothetical protein
MGSHQDRLCLFYLRDGLVTNKLGKAVKYSLVQIYYTGNSYLTLVRVKDISFVPAPPSIEIEANRTKSAFAD